MNKKSFFWPVLSDEEKQKAARAKEPRAVPAQAASSGLSSTSSYEPSGNFVELTSSIPAMPTSYPASNDDTGVAAGAAVPEYPTSFGSVGSASGAGDDGSGFGEAELNEPLLVLDNIHRSYEQAEEDLVVLNGANLTVRAGEMVALVAPSGAGKSTLLHIAGLLERPTLGEVYIAQVAQSQAVDRARTLMRRNEIGFVYQFHHLLAEFSALENVMLPQLIRGENRKEAEVRAKELLAYMKIDHRSDHRPSELSGGEKQRVAIARAMANAPRVLLADEPTGNLDPNTSEYVFKALNALVKQSGIAALVATHNLFLAERMDRQITLVDGKIVDL